MNDTYGELAAQVKAIRAAELQVMVDGLVEAINAPFTDERYKYTPPTRLAKMRKWLNSFTA